MTPGFEPLPSCRLTRSKPNDSTIDGGRRPGRDDDALARVAPGGAERRERKQVRGVVGADDEQGHRLITLRSRRSLSSALHDVVDACRERGPWPGW